MMVFGTVAGLYDTARPGYPPEVAGLIVEHHGGVPASMVEIGAGTGKGTEVFAAVGAPLTCIEPDPQMAAVLAERFPHATIHAGSFEEWAPPAGGVDLIACAMAWHWLDPGRRNDLAYAALAPGGTLAVLGHRYGYQDPDQGAAVQDALNALDPTVQERPIDWFHADVLASGRFTGVQKRVLNTSLPLAKSDYLALVRTFGPFLRHSPEVQRQGLAALGRLVDGFGGTVVLDLRTTLVLATKGPAPEAAVS
ncbi:class I SAM-dependent methyltransferase [Actinoplanes flavus]|uniref:Class I SAM-dependent methyltransferase n=1 Tax=Actinoplanes flavus TaxID=2820290 RepID=A0ABS3UZ48_9ACTN|nr:class I SAM-dependent methyltransferase [Actinoplanes flavus]MBO3743844.1 class I SAM-dependent methyltransferase [Actinoplanes flavus]